MGKKFIFKLFVFAGIFCLLSFGADGETNLNQNAAADIKTNELENSTVNNTPENKPIERESPRRKRSKAVETFLNREGWQSGVGYKEMQRYIKRLAHLCEDRMPGLVNGVAGGKRGILLNVTFKGQKSFYMARENTEEFLTAIIGDLEKMPEPVALSVYVTHNKHNIISAIKKGGKVKVKFLL
jgi:hypothetical protein